ncbi:hypothetical protein [Nocardia asteroides]|uniref:hypothetical protein n=1 Tax=Nocardia asteroides TaxID=1824 RepID=UPI001E4758DF|nr:hypothetical protein [Nocardia asteroides]UGT64464.1 hypothetical protein LTT61_14765 [Nocardia asteroides]
MARISFPRRVAALALLLGTVVCAGCGGSGSEGNDAAAQSVSSTSVAPSTPIEGEPGLPARPFTESPVLVEAYPIPFGSYSLVGPDRLAVVFETGSPECYGVAAKVIAETDSAVTIELRAGRRPDAASRMCTMIAVTGRLEVQLPSPLGQRQVLSAA